MLRTQCPNCQIRIRTADPPLHCPRCIVRGMGRFELIVLTGPSRSPAAQIEQTVIWAESRLITVRGELDPRGADALRHLLADTVGSGLPCIVLDLSTCRFLDAEALGVIAAMQLQLAAGGQELVVQGATGQVERLS